jgi:hypothetical protein
MNLVGSATPELLGLMTGGIVTLAVWMGLQHVLSRSSKTRVERKARRTPVPLTEASLKDYVARSQLLVDLETRLAAGLELNLSTEPQDLAWAVEEARELGIFDIAALEGHLKEKENLILRFGSRFRWETLRRGDGLRLLFQVMGASLGPERYMQFVRRLRHSSESPEAVLRAYRYVAG